VQSIEAQDELTTAESANDEININIFENMSSTISEGGLNLSQGQRQLLCLARAIVSRPKIMVLDEATSAVDMVTDRLIQRSIREEFKDSTLIVIAHRLSTIADFDKVLVLSEGKKDEFGSPRALLEKKGTFHNMIVESGDKELLESMILGESEDRSLLDERDSPESVNKGKGRQIKT
jgi:ABC-type multidrug transport system fused ATPase/permease subunit